MHQYLGFPQIRPTAAACNYKHPQSPDQRRLPALPKSPDNPQPKSFVSPAPLFDASLSAINPTLLPLLLTSFPERLKTQDELYYPASTVQNIHNVPTASAVAICADHKPLQLDWEAQNPNSTNHSYLRENDRFLLFFSPRSSFSVKVQGGKSREAAHYFCLCVNTVKNRIICLLMTLMAKCLCVHYMTARVEVVGDCVFVETKSWLYYHTYCSIV